MDVVPMPKTGRWYGFCVIVDKFSGLVTASLVERSDSASAIAACDDGGPRCPKPHHQGSGTTSLRHHASPDFR